MNLEINSNSIIERNVISLDESKIKMVKNGWGNDVIQNTTTEVFYYSNEGNKIKGYISYPNDLSKKYPLIIWNRGGNRESGKIDEFLATGMFGEIANWGYIVMASMYRDNDEFGGSEVNDILKLIEISDTIGNCDSSKIGMEGWSRGGFMTFHILTKTDRISTAVIISGLTDITNHTKMDKVYREIFGTGTEEEFLLEKKKRSPVYFADKIYKDINLLLIHGTGDEQVPHSNSEIINEKLKNKVKEIDLVLLEGGDHYLKKFRKETSELRKNWFNKFLK